MQARPLSAMAPTSPPPSLQRQWGLVERLPDGRLRARPLQQALQALDEVWDNMFEFGAAGRQQQAAPAAHAGGEATPGDSPGVQEPSRPVAARSSSCCSSSGPPGSDVGQQEGCAADAAEQGGAGAGRAMPPGCAAQLSAVPEGDEAPCSELSLGAAGEPQWEQASPPAAAAGDDGIEPAADCLGFTVEQPAADGRPCDLEAASEQDAAAVWPVQQEWEVGSHGAQVDAAPGVLDPPGLMAAGWEALGLRPDEPASYALEEAGMAEPPACGPEEGQGLAMAASPLRPAAYSSSSSDDLEWVLRVPSPSSAAAGGSAAAAAPPAGRSPRRSPSRLSLTQLRHLQSLRRQRLEQEAEALECLPASLRPRSDAAATACDAGARKPASQAAERQAGGVMAGSMLVKRAQGSRGGSGGKSGRGSRAVHVSVRAGRRSPSP